MKAPSIKDIAESLGVSKTLVSLVLNKRAEEYGISPETQKKVLNKAKELNYKPNRLAQGLRLGKSKIIGLVVADISNPFYSKISRHIEDLVDKKGYNLIICNSDENEKKERKIIQTLLERHVDGLIVTSTCMQPEEINQLNNENIPFVLVDRYMKDVKTNYVGVDNFNGAYNAVVHLVKKGCRQIGNITVTPTYISSLEDRKKGFLAAMKDYKINYNPGFDLLIPYENLESDLEKSLKKLFGGKQVPDGLFIANNKLAVESLKNFKKLGVRIPDDILVVCFDDIPLYEFFPAPINAVAQPIYDICRETVEILFSEINDSKRPSELERKSVILPAELIIR